MKPFEYSVIEALIDGRAAWFTMRLSEPMTMTVDGLPKPVWSRTESDARKFPDAAAAAAVNEEWGIAAGLPCLIVEKLR